MLSTDSEWRSRLDHILEVRGDADVYVPVLVDELRRLPLERRTESAMLSAVARSSHPAAVDLMIAGLNPEYESAPAWRYEAFVHLAGTGGPEGVDAVRQARAARAPLRPWFDRLQLSRLPPEQILATTTSDNGLGWMFFESDILGNDSDVFASHEGIDAWSRPYFTGVWSRPTFTERLERTLDGTWRLEPLVSPLPFAALDAWQSIARLRDVAAVFADRDGDGLTDAVEARLGTSPLNRDTDGDGDADTVDPCPNAAPRALNDLEQIVAAAVEARFFASPQSVPAVIRAPGIRPFDLSGYAGQMVIWSTRPDDTPLSRVYGGGVNIISFHAPYDDSGEESDEESTDESHQKFIEMSDDGRTARTVIRRYSGGLNGDGTEVHLRKIGDEWFVVDMKLLYLS
jgi:hypothetical protein